MQIPEEIVIQSPAEPKDTVSSDGCPLCGAMAFTLEYVLPDPNYSTVKCRGCGFVFMHPYPSDAFLDRHYAERALYGFDGEGIEPYKRAMEDRRRLIEKLLAANAVRVRDGFAVDFGAGTGMTVAALKALGFDALGLEKNSQAAAVGAKLFGVDILNKNLDEIEGIRLFTMFDVLEHIKHPMHFLCTVRCHLAEDACIIGAVPNYNGIGRYLHSTRSMALLFPEHVSQFTKRTIARMLAKAGYEVLYIGFPPPYGVTLSLGLRKALARRYGQRQPSKLVVDALTLLKKYAVYPPINLFAEKTGLLGHSLVFVARNPA